MWSEHGGFDFLLSVCYEGGRGEHIDTRSSVVYMGFMHFLSWKFHEIQICKPVSESVQSLTKQNNNYIRNVCDCWYTAKLGDLQGRVKKQIQIHPLVKVNHLKSSQIQLPRGVTENIFESVLLEDIVLQMLSRMTFRSGIIFTQILTVSTGCLRSLNNASQSWVSAG